MKWNRTLPGIFICFCMVCFNCNAYAQERSPKHPWPPGMPGQKNYTIVDTGQAQFYDNEALIVSPAQGESFFGQDAHYSGNQPLFVDNGDGTITDLITGLMWEKGFQKMTWADAQAGASVCNTGGYKDWHVPTIKEIYSLINFNGNQGTGDPSSIEVPPDAVPFIDTQYFDFEYGSMTRYIDVQFVTSTEYTSDAIGNPDTFFGLNLADGRIKAYPKTGNLSESTYPVRYVRGNSEYGINHFINNNDGTVTDDSTGLMWARVDSGDSTFADILAGFTRQDGSLNWEEAMAFCENLTYAGYSDWRLPNAKELHSIVDYTRSPDYTNSPAIDEMFETTPIKAENDAQDWPFFWTSTTFNPGMDAIIICFGEALGFFEGEFMDVHGAGCQRTDLKTGDPSWGFGPQGDVRRVYNFVRPVRDADFSKNGDLNDDGKIDRFDILILAKFLRKSIEDCPECDINNDGRITIHDIRKLTGLCTCPRCNCPH